MPVGRLAYYSDHDFKINNWFGTPFSYQTVLYFQFEFARPVFEIFTEVSEQSDNTKVKTFEAITEKISFDLLYVPPMLTTLFAIPLHDKVELQVLGTTTVYTLTNISLEDTGGPDSKLAKQTLTADMEVYSGSDCADQGYTKVAC